MTAAARAHRTETAAARALEGEWLSIVGNGIPESFVFIDFDKFHVGS